MKLKEKNSLRYVGYGETTKETHWAAWVYSNERKNCIMRMSVCGEYELKNTLSYVGYGESKRKIASSYVGYGKS